MRPATGEFETRHYSAAATAADPAIDRVVPSELAGLRLDQALARMFPEHSRSRLAAWVRQGRITVDAAVAGPSRKVRGGEQVHLVPAADPDRAAFAAEAIPLRVVYEDDDLLVIDKPAGLVVHPGSGNWAGTMLNALLHHAPQLAALPRAGIVHRLDKDTSGLLVVAKTLEAQTDLVRQLQARTVTRQYLAVVHGRVARAGRVDAPIGRHPTQRTRMAVVDAGKPATTHYRVRNRYAAATLIECTLETGRTHQIRVHLASIGHPLVGDPVYGSRRASGDSGVRAFARQALHAWRLALRHPRTGAELVWDSPLPADVRDLLQSIADSASADGA